MGGRGQDTFWSLYLFGKSWENNAAKLQTVTSSTSTGNLPFYQGRLIRWNDLFQFSYLILFHVFFHQFSRHNCSIIPVGETGETGELAKPQMEEPHFTRSSATARVDSTQHSHARYVAMKDSWSHGDDRRDRGRVDRGVTRPRRSRSPPPRRSEGDRDSKGRDQSVVKSRPVSDHDRPRERSPDRRRRPSRSPLRESGEEVRERNRGRELLDTRGSDKPKRSTHHTPSGKRRKSRSSSPSRSHHKKSRRDPSRSPERLADSASSSRREKKRRSLSPPPRRRSPERRSLDVRGEGRHKHHRDSDYSGRRERSPGYKHDRHGSSRHGSPRRHEPFSKHNRSPQRSPARPQKPRERSVSRERDRKRTHSPERGRRSDKDRYGSKPHSRQPSPRAPRGSKPSRGSSPRRDIGDRPPLRDDYREPSGKYSGKPKDKNAKSSFTASGANSIEVKSDKMAGRGFYPPHQGYNPNQQMQAAFPLKPQYNQGAPDPRQYSQSPQHHMTPGSYHSSPAQSPYNSGRGNWGGQPQQQYSPQP